MSQVFKASKINAFLFFQTGWDYIALKSTFQTHITRRPLKKIEICKGPPELCFIGRRCRPMRRRPETAR
jgi:hypothetical protein